MYIRGPLVATNFYSYSSNSNKNQDIFLKFSSFVHHKFVQFFEKILAITQTACQPRLILAKTLDASSNRICWDIFKRKKWWGSRPIGVTTWKDFSISLRKWRFQNFWKACGSTFTMSMAKLSIAWNFKPIFFMT